MRHAVFVLVIAFYVLVVAQNWAVYSGALMITLYVRSGGRWRAPVPSVPIRVGWLVDGLRQLAAPRP